MNIVEQMRLFMEPESIAFIGVPRDTGEGSLNVVENLVNYGFSGKIYPVNPNAKEILGIRAYPSIKDVPGKIDLAVILTPRSAVLGAVNECIEKKAKAIVIVAGGFADAGEEGKALQAQIVRIAREGGARILGPNSLGVANAFYNLSTAFLPLAIEKIPAAMICQTGMLFSGTPRFVLTGKAIDLANCSDIDFADGLEYFEDDPDVKLIALYIEGIQNGPRFVEVASRVARKKPILALKAGRSQLGAKAAQSHTGSLVGRDEVYDTVFKQCGIIRVSDMDELEDLSKAFLNLPLMKGRRIGIATISYAAGTLAVDACEDWNLEMAELSSETVARIKQLYPAWLSVRNPVDMGPASTTAESIKSTAKTFLEALLSDEQVDGVVFIVGALPQQKAFLCADIVAEVAETFKDKPIVSWLIQPDVNRELATEYDNTGKTVVYPTGERAVRSLARLAERS
ncbi:MAG: CoA-binding protein, partial [Chloroflexi bacterium CG07_land_8_20_14_0_80_51_10]